MKYVKKNIDGSFQHAEKLFHAGNAKNWRESAQETLTHGHHMNSDAGQGSNPNLLFTWQTL
jgi:hypothetical protein